MKPHQLHRPVERSGVGPVEVFRAVAPTAQPLHQTPQSWIRSQPAFEALVDSSSPEIAAALHTAGVANVDKIWTELAYHSVHEEVCPSEPSRLDSLYCCADVFEAFSFVEETGQGKFVYRGTVDEGVRWLLVDMEKFSVVEPASRDSEGYAQAWIQAAEQAHGYWAPASPAEAIGYAEVLAAGPVLLQEPKLRLTPVMRELGLLE